MITTVTRINIIIYNYQIFPSLSMGWLNPWTEYVANVCGRHLASLNYISLSWLG